MPIRSMQGDVLDAAVDAVVNTVNCVGVMGVGLAKQVKARWPHVYTDYRAFCQGGHLRPGVVHMVATNEPRPQWVINFPTKRHWRQRARLEDIEAALRALRRELVSRPDVRAVAVPPLGCGLGGLDWERQVRPLVVQYLGDLPIDIMLYEQHAQEPNIRATSAT